MPTRGRLSPRASMNQPSTEQLKKTPLNARHRALGAKMVPFGGWDMPVEYSGIVNEHLTVRSKAGLFDVSHMGQIEIAGKNALAAVQNISANDANKLAMGQAQYSALTTPAGTFVMRRYSGIVNEHLTVRSKAGLFDVSHMGQIEIAGKNALAAVQNISANDANKLAMGQAQYSALTTPAARSSTTCWSTGWVASTT